MEQTISNVGGCRGCGYDLRGLHSRNCPECGREFDPNDAMSVGPVGMRYGPLARWAITRTGWAIRIFTVVVVLTILWHARFPARVRDDSRIYRSLWQILFALWGGRMFIQLLAKAKMRERRFRRQVRILRTALILTLFVALGLLVGRDVLFDLAMKASRPAFARLSNSAEFRNVASGMNVKFNHPRWIGLYHISGGMRYVYDGSNGWANFDSSEVDATIELNLNEGDMAFYSTAPYRDWTFFGSL